MSQIQQKDQMHPAIQKMLSERDMTLKQLRKSLFKPENYLRTTTSLSAIDRDADCYGSDSKDYLYGFLDGDLIFIIHDFREAHDGVEEFSMKRLLEIMGPPDAMLASTQPMGFFEYLYLDEGIMITGNEPEDYYNSATVFQPMTLEQYKALLWTDPKQFGTGID